MRAFAVQQLAFELEPAKALPETPPRLAGRHIGEGSEQLTAILSLTGLQTEPLMNAE